MEKRDVIFLYGGNLKDKGPYRWIILKKADRAMVETVSGWSVTFEALIRSETSLFGISCGTDRFFVEILPLSAVSSFPPLLLIHSSLMNDMYPVNEVLFLNGKRLNP
jgi:hypothetical protein